jgi:hypothetical protein
MAEKGGGGILLGLGDERAAIVMASDAEGVRSRMNWMSGHSRPRQPVEMIDRGGDLRYSSPWPWALAVVLSLMLWAMLGWYFWRLSH